MRGVLIASADISVMRLALGMTVSLCTRRSDALSTVGTLKRECEDDVGSIALRKDLPRRSCALLLPLPAAAPGLSKWSPSSSVCVSPNFSIACFLNFFKMALKTWSLSLVLTTVEPVPPNSRESEPLCPMPPKLCDIASSGERLKSPEGPVLLV